MGSALDRNMLQRLQKFNLGEAEEKGFCLEGHLYEQGGMLKKFN